MLSLIIKLIHKSNLLQVQFSHEINKTRMKKIKQLILLISILGTTTLMAQSFGVKGGMSFTNINIEDDFSSRYRVGYHAGAFINLPLTDNFSFQPELLFSTKGTKADYEILDIKGESTLKLNYIEVPLLGVFNVGKVAQLNIGPYLGFLSSAKYEIDGDLEIEDDLDNDDFKELDYGLSAGFSLNFEALQIGARYNMGLSTLEDSEGAKYILGDAKNRAIQVYAALRVGNYE